MSFGAPVALFALLAIPALVAWYAASQRGRGRQREPFAAAALVPSVAPNRPGWRRHAPMVAFTIAIAVLIFALADPRTSHAQPVASSSIMLVCDVSGSMAATDVKPSRVRAVERAAARLVAEVPSHVSVGVMVFDQIPDVVQSPTTDRAADRRALTGWRPHGGTAIGTAIEVALGQLAGQGAKGTRPPAAIILISDGSSTSGTSPLAAARRAARLHIPIDTVALGTATGTITVHGRVERVPPDPTLLAAIARASHGNTYTAQDAGRLSAVYEKLGVKLSHRRVVDRLDAGFAGAALVLVLLGSTLSLRWFGRLI
jgi:Ca-activated chloride channel homolog